MSDALERAVGDARVLLLDADGNLFPSEVPAFEASCEVTNALLADNGVRRRFQPEELRRATLGRNFRTTAVDLLLEHGVEPPRPQYLESWVERERRRVTSHLAAELDPDPGVIGALRGLRRRYRLAVVSSSAKARLAACLEVTDLAETIPPALIFSSEDSLPVPASKPDPAIYAFACESLGIGPGGAIAVEDSVAGVESAAGAGVPVVGNLAFVPDGERAERAAQLSEAGACAVLSGWSEVRAALFAPARSQEPATIAEELSA